MWDLAGPGLEPVSPALAGGFLTTAPPGPPEKSLALFLVCSFLGIVVSGLVRPRSVYGFDI